MAVLIEGISIVIRHDAIIHQYTGGWGGFIASVPNATLCCDGQLVRVGFLKPDAVKRYARVLNASGLTFMNDGRARDYAVVDQLKGPTTRCDWIEFTRLRHNDKGGKVSAAWLWNKPRLAHGIHLPGKSMHVDTPHGWSFEGSLSDECEFVPGGLKH
jgi:hypothetical protein